MKTGYILTSRRLGFRPWKISDLDDFAALNADKDVMEHFPRPLSVDESADFISRLQKHYTQYGHCYFATEILETGEFIGFIGLAFQKYESKFTPAVDIGWRLKKSVWGKGYATEGALRCLDFGFKDLKLSKIMSTCPEVNHRSEKVMQKIGMKKTGEFIHPNLADYPEIQKCVCYSVSAEDFTKAERALL